MVGRRLGGLILLSLLVACTAPRGDAVRSFAFPLEPAVGELAGRAGLVRLLVYAPGEARRGPRRQVVNGGSGTLLGTLGIVATAAHVATDPVHRILVQTLDGREHDGFTVGFDPGQDLALVCVPDLVGTRGAAPRLQAPETSEPVLGFGFPASGRVAVAAGRVRRGGGAADVHYGSFGIERPMELELVIAPGYSGGPVVDTHGRLVGILAGFAMDFEGETPRMPGIAYAVPAARVSGAPLARAVAACRATHET